MNNAHELQIKFETFQKIEKSRKPGKDEVIVAGKIISFDVSISFIVAK